jgi:hypothetical protein
VFDMPTEPLTVRPNWPRTAIRAALSHLGSLHLPGPGTMPLLAELTTCAEWLHLATPVRLAELPEGTPAAIAVAEAD